MDADTEPEPDWIFDEPLHRWPRRVAVATLIGVLVVLVAAGLGIGTQLALARTDHSLDRAHDQVHGATAKLETTDRQLSAAKTRSVAAGIVLAGESAQLAADQADLARTQADVFAKGVNIADLDTCLSGVEQVLNEIAVGDTAGAAATLAGVSPSCRAAAPGSS